MGQKREDHSTALAKVIDLRVQPVRSWGPRSSTLVSPKGIASPRGSTLNGGLVVVRGLGFERCEDIFGRPPLSRVPASDVATTLTSRTSPPALGPTGLLPDGEVVEISRGEKGRRPVGVEQA